MPSEVTFSVLDPVLVAQLQTVSMRQNCSLKCLLSWPEQSCVYCTGKDPAGFLDISQTCFE